MATALFVIRAQPLHLGHLKVIKDILKENEKVIIAIGSAQAGNTENNPFSAEEREEMVSRALEADGIKNYEIVKVPDAFDDKLWAGRVKKACRFDVAYSMNPWTIRCFRNAEIKVKKHGLYRRGSCSGTKIRKKILEGGEWEALVPKPVAEYIKRIRGEERIRELSKKS